MCYIGTDTFVYEIETGDFYREIAQDVKKTFDTTGYSKNENRPLPILKNKKVVVLMKYELS